MERQSGDGLPHIHLRRLACDRHARIDTSHGVFAGRGHLITIAPLQDGR